MKDQTKSEKPEGRNVSRRSILKAGGIAGVLTPITAVLAGRLIPGLGVSDAQADAAPPPASIWNGAGYFVHDSVDASNLSGGAIRARLNSTWKTFRNRNIGNAFLNWNLQARIDALSSGMTCLDGPHSGALATYGAGRGDSAFTVNNAFKGFGPVPIASKLDESIQMVLDNWNASSDQKIAILTAFYQDHGMWDQRMLDSLELYSTPKFQTHSFLNQFLNPQATIVFLAIPGSYEVRAIPRLIHPNDPNVSAEDYKRVRWGNMIHDFFHGGPYPDKPTRIYVIYYVVEVFDDSPVTGGQGLRTVPAL